MKCPVCRYRETHGVMRSYDDRYGYPGRFSVMRCSNCGHAFLDGKFSSIQLTELYTKWYPRKSFDIEKYRAHVEQRGFSAWFSGLYCSSFRWVPKNVRVLDVGCGFGESLGYHSARGCDVYGVEADENILRVVERFGYKVHVGLFDDIVYEPEYFDYVTMDQVIEHVTDPLLTLRGIARILKPGGTAVLSTPNASGWGAKIFGKRWINWHTPYHLQFFSTHSMRIAAEQSGFDVVNVQTITNSEWLLYQWIHLVTFPPVGKPSWFWSPNKNGAAMLQKLIVKLLLIIHKTKLNHLLTRAFDSLSVGDNFVFVLRKL